MRVLTLKYGRIMCMAVCFVAVYLILNMFEMWTNPELVKFRRRRQGHLPILIKGLGNFEPKNIEKREGPGENGEAYKIPAERAEDAKASREEYGMNMVCSDSISINRSIKDTRLEECKHWVYDIHLDQTSVIIVFNNEGFSVLMRTVHSVVNRSPPGILAEILLIDDFSDKEDLKDKLDKYIVRFNGLVRIIRNTERNGIPRSRNIGANKATGDAIVFLDAHCEVNINWLPPLLLPIYISRRVMTVPAIDNIDNDNFQYETIRYHTHFVRGIFEWGMLYKEIKVPKKELDKRSYYTEPYESPTFAGGLFAINRDFFLKLGGYDPGLLHWGGENYDLSFKMWQCGGIIVWVPCSRVGHVYKSGRAISFERSGKWDWMHKNFQAVVNYKRVVETWFDEKHKEYFYTRIPYARFIDMGDITKQLRFKKDQHCKNFDWYMDNIAYDLYDNFPPLPKNLHWGQLQSVASELCFDCSQHEVPCKMFLGYCDDLGDYQIIRLNAAGQLGFGEKCIEAFGSKVHLVACKLGTVNGPWEYNNATKQLIHKRNKMFTVRNCMAFHPRKMTIYLELCYENSIYQHWEFISKTNYSLD